MVYQNVSIIIGTINLLRLNEYEVKFRPLFGRKLKPIDCQNLFCEISKYARVAHPEVKGVSGRNRIKQSYSRNYSQLPEPYFPDRWGINNEVKDFIAKYPSIIGRQLV